MISALLVKEDFVLITAGNKDARHATDGHVAERGPKIRVL
jgi:hypothetical protein